MQRKAITFSKEQLDFCTTLNQRVNDYFRIRKLSKHGNWEMFIKTICMFALYWTPYLAIVTGVVTHPLLLFSSVVVMSIGLAGIGLSVMHDANHGAYAKTKWINTLIGYSLNLVGANAFNWKIQHNVLHHTYTNVQDEDEDISHRGVLRMTPHSAWKSIHQYQYLYAWFLYGLMTIVWMAVKDFERLVRYQRNGLAKKYTTDIKKEWAVLIFTKLIYVSYIFILPLALTSIAWWQVLVGIFVMHYIAGFLLAIIFQPAHVIDGSEFPLPDNHQVLKNNWAIHQLCTTTNFGNQSKWFSWFVGGLNFQIEHHLFPNICHVHYRNIAAIVRRTTADFGLPYKSSKTFFNALIGHAKMLQQLGRKPECTIRTSS